MSFLLDTNVISEVRKPRGDALAKAWIAAVPANSLYLSVLVVGEIRRGIEHLQRHNVVQAAVYEDWLTRLQLDYADRILPITVDIAQEWGRINALNTVPVIDGLLAATAKVQGLTLVTRNTPDFVRTGVTLLNPFKP